MFENTNYNDLFSALFAVVFTLNGIVLPFSYDMISDKTKEYSDRFFFDKFIASDEFQTNIYSSLFCAVFFLIPLFVNIDLDIKSGDDDLIMRLRQFRAWYLVLTAILLIKFFRDFIRLSVLIYRFVANTEEVVFEYIKSDIDGYLED